MKIVFIAGLEHSGTTLTDHLLSQRLGYLGLGEVAQFFSPVHMKQYMAKWGNYADVDLCSCGERWHQCSFWSRLTDLCGLRSESSYLDKYGRLLDHVRATRGSSAVIVDSSKSLPVLRDLISGARQLKLSTADLHVVYTVKDVRSFSASMLRKNKQASRIASVLRAFNYWSGVNREYLEFLEASGVSYTINLYERLCQEPDRLVKRIASAVGAVGCDAKGTAIDTHIAIGNKDFVVRNRDKIRYDSRWFVDDAINIAYAMHVRARRLNKSIHALSATADATDEKILDSHASRTQGE